MSNTIIRNPWKGLSSYEENDNQHYEFRGRSRASNDLYLLLTNNLFTTLYGKTGSGKTSLLQAGVFPMLRQELFVPIVIRLNMSNEESFADYIIKRLKEEHTFKVEENENWKERDAIEGKAEYKLWHFLYAHNFVNEHKQNVFPVIVIDQMEEAFLEHPQQAHKLIEQLYYAISDDLLLPKDSFPQFRIITIIREDYLYLMEDAIGYGNYNILRQNRYRLAPLTDDEAREIIGMAPECFMKGEEEEITEAILQLSKDETGQISTYLLSFICSQLFIDCKGVISKDKIPKENSSLMKSYYKSCIEKISVESRQFIEGNLIKDGHRYIVKYKDFEQAVKEDLSTLTKGSQKLVQKITIGENSKDSYAELLHDSLAEAISLCMQETKEQQQNERELQIEKERNEALMKRKRKLQRALFVIGVAIACVIPIIFFLYMNSKKEAAEEKKKAEEESYKKGIKDGKKGDFYVTFKAKPDTTFTNEEDWNVDMLLFVNDSDRLAVDIILPDSLYTDSIHFEKENNPTYTARFTRDEADSIIRFLTLKIIPRNTLCKPFVETLVLEKKKELTHTIIVRKEIKDMIEYKGMVTDTNSVPLNDVLIKIGEQETHTTTDGTYRLLVPQSTSLRNIYALKLGYKPYYSARVVAKNDTIELKPVENQHELFEQRWDDCDSLFQIASLQRRIKPTTVSEERLMSNFNFKREDKRKLQRWATEKRKFKFKCVVLNTDSNEYVKCVTGAYNEGDKKYLFDGVALKQGDFDSNMWEIDIIQYDQIFNTRKRKIRMEHTDSYRHTKFHFLD